MIEKILAEKGHFGGLRSKLYQLKEQSILNKVQRNFKKYPAEIRTSIESSMRLII